MRTQGPASHVLCDFVSVCVGIMGKVWFSFFLSNHCVCFLSLASVLYTCFSMYSIFHHLVFVMGKVWFSFFLSNHCVCFLSLASVLYTCFSMYSIFHHLVFVMGKVWFSFFLTTMYVFFLLLVCYYTHVFPCTVHFILHLSLSLVG